MEGKKQGNQGRDWKEGKDGWKNKMGGKEGRKKGRKEGVEEQDEKEGRRGVEFTRQDERRRVICEGDEGKKEQISELLSS